MQGTGAALMHPAFARFLQRVGDAPLDSDVCALTMQLIKDMSESYLGMFVGTQTISA